MQQHSSLYFSLSLGLTFPESSARYLTGEHRESAQEPRGQSLSWWPCRLKQTVAVEVMSTLGSYYNPPLPGRSFLLYSLLPPAE